MTPQHSPTPWRIDATHPTRVESYDPAGEEWAHPVADCGIEPANAAFIVCAVNSYVALVEACESMRAALEEGCAARGFTANHEAKARLAGTAALALAKGGTP